LGADDEAAEPLPVSTVGPAVHLADELVQVAEIE
jgi:hypothetical protein